MPAGSATIEIRAASAAVFDLLHDYSRRLEWDPFLREACLLNGATSAGIGVSSRCVARRIVGGLAMETRYLTFAPPRVAAVNMVRGPWLFRTFAASICQHPTAADRTQVTYRYHFQLRPRWLTWLLNPLVHWIFHRETRRRLAALKDFLEAGSRTSKCQCYPISVH